MTKPTPAIHQIHPDIPTDRAWRVGRRIYVRCGYKSQLNAQMRDIGAKWDPDERALWVGSGKADQVVPLVQAAAERGAAIDAVKAAGHWVTIPYDAADIRQAAKKAGGIWDGERKQWAMPSAEALAEITALIDARKAAARAELAERDRLSRLSAAEKIQRIIDRSGRTVAGEQGVAEGWLRGYGRMRRAEAERVAPQPGDVRRLRDGQRVLVLTVRVEYWSQDAIDDQMPHEEPGWRYMYDYVPVQPDAQEAAADAQEAAEQADHAEIDRLVSDVRQAARHGEETDEVPDGPAIVAHLTVTGLPHRLGRRDGTVTLIDQATIHWYHPGWYDDARTTSRTITDPELVARVEQVIAGGERTRGRYQVRP